MKERLRIFPDLPLGLDGIGKSIVIGKRCHPSSNKLFFLAVVLRINGDVRIFLHHSFFSITGNEFENATLDEAPAAADLFSRDLALLGKPVDRLDVDPQQCGYLIGSDDLFHPLKFL